MRDRQSYAGKSTPPDRLIRVGSMDDADPDIDFWIDTSDRERLHALQLCREACLDELP